MIERPPRHVEITSSSNSHFQRFKSLLTAKGIKNENSCLVAGQRIIRDLILGSYLSDSRQRLIAEIISHKTFKAASGVQNPFLTLAPHRYVISTELFNELDEMGSGGPLLVVEPEPIAQLHSKEWLAPQLRAGLSVILPLGDPGNLGAAIRSCVAFGAKNIVLTSESAHPFLPKSIKASAGAALMTRLYRGGSLKEIMDSLQSLKIPTLGLDSKGEDLVKFKWNPTETVLIVGEEGQGLPLPAERCLRIPISTVESLNATAALTIALYDFNAKQVTS